MDKVQAMCHEGEKRTMQGRTRAESRKRARRRTKTSRFVRRARRCGATRALEWRTPGSIT